ncbi:S8 family serine peptidase [Polaribacter sp. KT 15]|uniref:S8 family serine peptidase n=1 Tax=Polaribacter sp. KT 15 TaxID=1896175 RepID=UPI00090A865F|nr:S8 family serine peptidase [Polaribacter sp. KT 15]SHM69541.1 Por secretion system C-terminal sorting domain-containing protein [Polaribacter sp. KT 15]
MKKLLLFLFAITFFQAKAQEDAWLFLKDKPSAETYLENPLLMLSQRALDRRNKLNIAVGLIDVPIENTYIETLKTTNGITVLGASKWLNAVHIQATQSDIENAKQNLSFIDYIEYANKSLNQAARKGKKIKQNHQNKFNNSMTDFTYGSTKNQIEMLKGDFLHGINLTAKNQIIAVIDAGFPNVNTLQAFQRLRDNDKILGGYDFVERSTDFYSGHNHGTNVLSTIGGYIENEFVGSAPDASFYLFRTENASVEVPLEETLWVEAAERADSLGVDVINTSLGYSTFDNPDYNYNYNDMDGKTTFISRGAEVAANRGILVVNSAGNSGTDSWKYITAPADAASVITVGSVDSNGNISSFSSFGPTSDGRIKPEILAQGTASAIINHTDNSISSASGTSFSAPIMAGLIACLNDTGNIIFKTSNKKDQAKQLNNRIQKLKQSIIESADKFNNPTDQHGYGIPNFETAYNSFLVSLSTENNSIKNVEVYPNPVLNELNITIDNLHLSETKVTVYTILGKKILTFENKKNIDVSSLKSGVYLLKIKNGTSLKSLKFIKK